MNQSAGQAIDIADWSADEEFHHYPEGARDKSLIISPDPLESSFLRPKHRYLYKHSSHRYPEQFWVEIFAYRFSACVGVDVPPAFVSYDSDNQTSGALIEWFLDLPEKAVILPDEGVNFRSYFVPKKWWSLRYWFAKFILFVVKDEIKINIERYVPGGDYFQRKIPNFDRKKGTQHNFEDISKICTFLEKRAGLKESWLEYWAKALTFDALIGNTDRHQDNWGVIWQTRGVDRLLTRLTPVFDNGTSMGHEIQSDRFGRFDDENYIRKYVSKGQHHMKWTIDDEERATHAGLLLNLCGKYPSAIKWIQESLSFDDSAVENIVSDLIKFDVPIPLREDRAEFMVRLLLFRKNKLLELF